MFRVIAALSILCLVAANGLNNTDGLKNDDRIVNGKKADINEMPYQVSLQSNGGHFCGGSVLSTEWILTAAHCLVKYLSNTDDLTVRCGTSTWPYGGVVKGVASVKIHPEYNPVTMEYDVGLIQLLGRLVYSSIIKPIKIIQTLPPPGTPLIVSGWGKTSENSLSIPTDLQAVIVHYVPEKECSSNQYHYGISIKESMFCATLPSKDSCQGDSGGPINIVDTNTQVGIVSWGVGCAQSGKPGIYCDLANRKVRGFIRSHCGI